MACDSYYKTKNQNYCVNSLYNLYTNSNGNDIETVMTTEYHKNIIFPFFPYPD